MKGYRLVFCFVLFLVITMEQQTTAAITQPLQQSPVDISLHQRSGAIALQQQPAAIAQWLPPAAIILTLLYVRTRTRPGPIMLA